MAKKSPLKQPTANSRTRAEPPVFHLQTMPDPDAHLTEEQKKWPLIGGWEPLPSTGESGPPPEAQQAEPQPKSPPAA